MATFRELEVVQLGVPVEDAGGRCFPAGTAATIVELSSDDALVEVVEHDGRTDGPFDVAISDIHPRERIQAA